MQQNVDIWDFFLHHYIWYSESNPFETAEKIYLISRISIKPNTAIEASAQYIGHQWSGPIHADHQSS